MGKLMKQNIKYHGLGVVSGVLLIGVVIGGIGGQVLAQMKGPTDMKGVSVTELGIINEESLKAQLGIEGFILRMRAVTVEPGGHILEHSHATAPGLVKMVSGTWIEGHPDGREITYRAGDDVALPEDKDTVHWIYNRGDVAATGVVCGIQPSQ
jgi:quercetin dioxygenase-like cupin family protein